MNKKIVILFIITLAIACYAFTTGIDDNVYNNTYFKQLNDFRSAQMALVSAIETADMKSGKDIQRIEAGLQEARYKLKAVDFWLRYMEPTVYKKINGPLPVEWETEVFEKFEKPYKREGAGLTLAALYMEEEGVFKDSLLSLIKSSLTATEAYSTADSITRNLSSYHHFYLCNRLFLLNLAAIYTTGFENPDTSKIIPELRAMLYEVEGIYNAFNQTYTSTPLTGAYKTLYKNTISFVNTQPTDYTRFDHFSFIRDYVNPLFVMNQEMIKHYKVVSRSMIDYSLNKTATSIFDKGLYNGQNVKGIFLRVTDTAGLAMIDSLGKLLFYDPILSGNNMRSCVSCHKSGEYFTDTTVATALQFDHKSFLPRNTPTLINAAFNHLAMLDGKHTTLQEQGRGVIMSGIELGGNEKEILEKILSCDEYAKGFKKLLKYTPQEPELCFEHITSALSLYYSRFSKYYAPFDKAINGTTELDAASKQGFNIFMSKAQCATCHFVPMFNGVKPPYIGSEFEVLGTPADTGFRQLSADKGRYNINPAGETLNAFRTGTVRNAMHTAPYMHNGVFKTMEQVIDFYDAGGGAGRGLKLENQTLSPDSLHLSRKDKTNLMAFIKSLDEEVVFDGQPKALPKSRIKALNKRKVGGEY